MKAIIVVMSLIFSLTNTLAGPGGGGGGIGTLPPQEVLKSFPLNEISEVMLLDGSYYRIQDINENILEVRGALIDSGNLVILNNTEVKAVIDQEAEEISII